MTAFSIATAAAAPQDPYLWLEDIDGQKALEWVKQHNLRTETELTSHPKFQDFEADTRKILLSDDRLPAPVIHGDSVYNFWQDKTHVRGIFRRTNAASYRSEKPEWEIVIDLDQLAEKENENWVWHGANFAGSSTSTRCLISLSRGGKDADVVREFDLKSKEFVPNGFYLPEAKSTVSWFGDDALIIGTDFGEDSLTKSGYPRLAKLWRRGTDLNDATTLLEGIPDDVAVSSQTFEHRQKQYTFLYRSLDFYNTEYHFVKPDGSIQKLPLPTSVELQEVYNEQALFSLLKDWKPAETTFKSGSLISISLCDIDAAPEILFQPAERETLEAVEITSSTILLHTLNNVRGRLLTVSVGSNGYEKAELPLPPNGSVRILSSDPHSDRFYVQFEDFLTPQTLLEGGRREGEVQLTEIKSLAPKFSSEGLEVLQWEAISDDGTSIPYFILKKKNLQLDGSTPTILYGYGGFQVSLTPGYTAVAGKLWLEQGNVYVIANIRGGGEYGPQWHQAALKGNRQRAYDDFKAVARDLIDRKVTSPDQLGIMGGSNGGLLMGVMFTQAPELFQAVVCQVPLLDMLRFHKLLAGHSWTGEYGNPENPEEAEYISKYSPYQNVKTGADYPNIFFVTSSKDDRVHPGHARKMAARLEELGYNFDYYENIEGGHGAAANLEQRIYRTALEYTYFQKMLLAKPQD